MKKYQKGIVLVALSAALGACGGGGGGGGTEPVEPPPPPPPEGQNVSELYSDMQTWDDFSPKLNPVENEGVEIPDETVEPDVRDVPDPDNNLKVCTTETVDFYNTPEEYVMFAPPTNVLYPGGFVVGRSLRDGAGPGDLLPINIDQRTEVDVTIAACNFAGNARRVPPTLAAVNAAVGDIIFQAGQENVDCINAQGNLKVETYRNENQRALSAGISGRYFGFSASASGSFSKETVENSVAAVFRESLYTVDISAPQTPDGWFTDEFTEERLEEQKALGTMAEDNIPVYVARVTYGRLMTSTFTSTESEKNLRTAVEFKYNNPAASVSGELATESQRIRENSRITLSYIGGSADATAAMLQSNDWTQYFSDPVRAEDAVPISFELRSTKDNVPAVVQELTSYERTTCLDKVGDDATFTLSPEFEFTPTFSESGQTVAVGDIDGVNGDDIVWAATALGARGEYAIALSNGDGTFQSLIQGEHDEANGVTGNFALLLTDIDNDGADDIVLNVLPPSGDNTAFVSFIKDGSLINSAPQLLRNGTGWDNYIPYTGQFDGARGSDLAFNNTPISTTTNRTYVAEAVDTTAPGFDLATDVLLVMRDFYDHPANNFSGYNYTHVADFNNDGLDDMVWQSISVDGNRFHGIYSTPDGFTNRDFQDFDSSWVLYTAMVGDVTGDGNADIVEPRARSVFDNFGIYIAEGSGVGVNNDGVMFDPHTFKYRNRAEQEASIVDLFGEGEDRSDSQLDIFLADVNGDGAEDIILNDKGYLNGATNQVGVGLAVVGGSEFTFARVSQSLAPQRDWSQYQALVGDINGDGKDDVLWIANAATSSVFVATSR